MSLDSLGWNIFFQNAFETLTESFPAIEPARIVCEYKNYYKIKYQTGESLAEVSGKFRYMAADPSEYPVVGDWVAITRENKNSHAIIHALIPRKTMLSRKAPGTTTYEQVVAANIDIAFIVTSCDRDFNVRRIERYLTFVYESGANPVIILNKADICEQTESFVMEIEEVAIGTPIIVMSATSATGSDELFNYLCTGKTACFIGSSGVGKSSIINMLSGKPVLKTGDTRKDGKGKHTTTHRELFVLGEKGIVIDNPGMREIQLWADEETMEKTFSDIEELSTQCKFFDCSHVHEPGCAVLEAITDGSLDENRYNSYMKQRAELHKLSAYKGLTKKEIQQKRKEEGKRIALLVKNMKKEK